MLELGYALSSEEHSPTELVNFAQQAEAVGFNFAMLSDHGPDPRVITKPFRSSLMRASITCKCIK